jgi:hypothetical protein
LRDLWLLQLAEMKTRERKEIFKIRPISMVMEEKNSPAVLVGFSLLQFFQSTRY